MPANSSGKYRGRRLDPVEAFILVTFRDAIARRFSRLGRFHLNF
jgi:hypothetical protein